MTVLAGVWQIAGIREQPLSDVVASMLAAQTERAVVSVDFDARHIVASGQVAIGQADGSVSFRRYADGQLRHPRRLIVAVDARVDNRSELFERLDRRADPLINDSRLISLAYQRWGDAIVDHLLGDFAIAVWNPSQQAISLIRDPTGQRPLHYCQQNGGVAFASVPQGLFPLVNKLTIDRDRLGKFVIDLSTNAASTFFEGVSRVAPGQIVRIDRGGVHARSYWRMPTGELHYASDQDYIEAYREQLDRATRVRLRDAGDKVAAHLSSGLDSGAVAATAARLLAPDEGRVLAFTSAPRVEFDGPVPYGRIADESVVAASVAARYDNMDHIVLHTGDASPLDYLDDSSLFAEPIGHPCNNVWWRATRELARAHGASVLLTGEMGNLSISAGGLNVLSDLIRTGRLPAWLAEVIALRRSGGPRWRGLMASSFAPWLPKTLMSLLSQLSAGGSSDPPDRLLINARSTIPTERASRYQSERELRWGLLTSSDPGNFRKGAWLRWGIDERDPTSDRRLIEYCFSLPPSQLLGGGQTRRLARGALADRLPATVLDGVRGYQYADWYESLDQARLASFAARVAESPAAAAVIDFDAVKKLIADWPPGDWASARTIGTYRIALLRALSAGSFALNAGA